MAENSKIEWTDHTFNIVWGCQKVSPACTNCYAEAFSKRLGKDLWGADKERQVMSDDYWKQPSRWNKKAEKEGQRKRVFCSSMADVFEDHPTVNEQRLRLFKLIDQTPYLDWLLLTKRPENILRMMVKTPWDYCPRCNTRCNVSDERQREELFYLDHDADEWKCKKCDGLVSWNRDNVMFGATAENQEWADKRIPELLEVYLLCQAPRFFLSCEPLLGGINLRRIKDPHPAIPNEGITFDALSKKGGIAFKAGIGLDWVIVGGESGPQARPMNPGWVRLIQEQCEAAGVAFHFKQWGEYRPGHIAEPHVVVESGLGYRSAMVRVGKKAAGRLLDGVEYNELPR